jgi:hypothetical protein
MGVLVTYLRRRIVESKAVGLLRKFESVKVRAEEVYDGFKQLEARLFQTPSMTVEYTQLRSMEDGKLIEARMILDEYNRSSSDVYNITKVPLPYISVPRTVEEAKGVLHQIMIECASVVGFLDASITPLSPEDVDKLNRLRSELAEVTAKLDVDIEKNLQEAINEQEKGHCLASALITSRVINHILDHIQGEDIDKKIKFLHDRNVIGKEREEETFIIKASKRARNIFSHDIRIFANPSDSLSLLGDSIKMLRMLAQLGA